MKTKSHTEGAEQVRHSPLPWKAEYSDVNDGWDIVTNNSTVAIIAGRGEGRGRYPEVKANAAFIVTACNAHEELLEALKAVQPFLQMCKENRRSFFPDSSTQGEAIAYSNQVDAAIAKAEVK